MPVAAKDEPHTVFLGDTVQLEGTAKFQWDNPEGLMKENELWTPFPMLPEVLFEKFQLVLPQREGFAVVEDHEVGVLMAEAVCGRPAGFTLVDLA